VDYDIPFPVIDSGSFDWGWSFTRTPSVASDFA